MKHFIYKDVNYLDIVKAKVGDEHFYASKSDLEHYCKNTSIVITDERPTEFNTELHISLRVGRHKELLVNVESSLDALGLGQTLTRVLGVEGCISSHARSLAWFDKGALVGDIRTLDDFYTNITDEERELTRLK